MVLGSAWLDPRFGLTLVLFLRDKRPDLERTADEDALVRAGEVSREDKGEFGFEGEVDLFSERGRLGAGWCRMEARAGPAAGPECLFEDDECMACVGVVLALDVGSRESRLEVVEEKESSVGSVMMEGRTACVGAC